MFQPRMTASELGLIARVIHQWDVEPTDGCLSPAMADIRHDLAITFADALETAKVNSQFDRARFIRAATTGVNTKEATR